MTECSVCYQDYNKSTRKEVTCGHCQFKCCKQCVRTYLTSSIKNAHCMNCNKEFDRRFLVENLNNSFVNTTYKDHRANILLDREKVEPLSNILNLEAHRLKLLIIQVDLTNY